MPKNQELIISSFILIIAVISNIIFFSTIRSHLIPEFMAAKAIPLAILSGLSLVALALLLKRK